MTTIMELHVKHVVSQTPCAAECGVVTQAPKGYQDNHSQIVLTYCCVLACRMTTRIRNLTNISICSTDTTQTARQSAASAVDERTWAHSRHTSSDRKIQDAMTFTCTQPNARTCWTKTTTHMMDIIPQRINTQNHAARSSKHI